MRIAELPAFIAVLMALMLVWLYHEARQLGRTRRVPPYTVGQVGCLFAPQFGQNWRDWDDLR